MSVHKRANNGTYYVSYRDAGGRQRTKTFGKGREGKRDAQRFDEEIKARKLIEATHQVCPYSNATRNNVDVRLHVTAI